MGASAVWLQNPRDNDDVDDDDNDEMHDEVLRARKRGDQTFLFFSD
jgi:hypothetical protein